MFRLGIIGIIAGTVLAACGQVITITLPDTLGGALGGAPAARALPEGYELLFSPAPHAFRAALPGEPVRRGAASERFELRDGDCGGSDCVNPRYRSEITETGDAITARLNQDIWYGWSFYNETIGPATRTTSLGIVTGQWKMSGEQPPVFRLVQTIAGEGNWADCDPAICNRFGDPAEDVVVELGDMRAAYGWGEAQNFGNVCRLFGMAQNQGRWVDIVVNTNFATTSDGYLRIWVNGVLKCNYYGRLVSDQSAAAADPGPSHRRGIFGSYTQRWTENQGSLPRPVLIARYDEFLSGPTRTDVDTRMRELNGLPPTD